MVRVSLIKLQFHSGFGISVKPFYMYFSFSPQLHPGWPARDGKLNRSFSKSLERNAGCNPAPSALTRPVGLGRFNAAFTLIEIVIALGIIGFAVVPMVGLLGVGLNTFRAATEVSVGTQISQRIINELQQTDFDALIKAPSNSIRYFDDQGNETGTSKSNSIYQVNTRISPATELPVSETNSNLATATIQVANNPGQLALVFASGQTLWAAKVGISISTFFTVVSRNK